MKDSQYVGLSLLLILVLCGNATADQEPHEHAGFGQSPIRADGHAPIGVMGDHMHAKGGWMLSYRLIGMSMRGSRIGSNSVTPENIATTVPNRFFGQPMQPPTLRIVPLDMSMEMHMFGAMYAPADWITLTAMTSYQQKEMDLATFQGPTGTTRLGNFSTRSEGIGDTQVGALIALHGDSGRSLHLNFGLSLPSGSTTEDGVALAPTGARPTIRLPYSMQLGSGTYDILPGITYSSRYERASWGMQYRATLRTGDNNEGYALGDEHHATTWVSYRMRNAASTSLRLTATHVADIDGIDPHIVAPVQTADPAYYGGDRIDAALGLNLVAQSGALRGHRLAVEINVPVYHHLNGPQLEVDWRLNAGWQYAF